VLVTKLVYDVAVNVANCLSLSIPTFVCNNDSRSYTLTDSNSSTSYTYTVPSGWQINGGSNTLTTSSTTITITVSSTATHGFNPISILLIILVTERRTSGSDHLSPGVMRLYPSGWEGTNPATLLPNHTYPFLRASGARCNKLYMDSSNGIYVGKRQSHGSVCTNQNSQL